MTKGCSFGVQDFGVDVGFLRFINASGELVQLKMFILPPIYRRFSWFECGNSCYS